MTPFLNPTRVVLMAILIGSQGVLAIPIAFATAATAEALALGGILSFKTGRRLAVAEASA